MEPFYIGHKCWSEPFQALDSDKLLKFTGRKFPDLPGSKLNRGYAITKVQRQQCEGFGAFHRIASVNTKSDALRIQASPAMPRSTYKLKESLQFMALQICVELFFGCHLTRHSRPAVPVSAEFHQPAKLRRLESAWYVGKFSLPK